jgi:hypothetical protein
MKKLRLGAAVLAGVALVSVGAAAAATVGDISGNCSWSLSGDAYGIQTSPAYAMPRGGTLTSWSFAAWAGYPAHVQLKVFRPLSGNTYRVVGESAEVTAVGGTFPTKIAVRKRDLLGIANLAGAPGSPCEDDTRGWSNYDGRGNPQPGDVITPPFPYPLRFQISAVLNGRGGKKTAMIPEVEHIFLCYSKFQTDPGVWGSGTAALLLKTGYWLPYALPGNLDGATNLGSYHLACNLTGTQTPTGGFVDDGGGTWSADYAAMTGLYPQAA